MILVYVLIGLIIFYAMYIAVVWIYVLHTDKTFKNNFPTWKEQLIYIIHEWVL